MEIKAECMIDGFIPEQRRERDAKAFKRKQANKKQQKQEEETTTMPVLW